MRLLSPILQRVVYPTLGTLGYFHRRSLDSISVVTYHGVLPEGYCSADRFLDAALVSSAQFRSQLRLLKKHYNVISPDQFLGWVRQAERLPERAVLLTCDDGLLNNLTTMLPILQDEGLQCLFFLTGEPLDGGAQMLWYVELYLMLMQVAGPRPPIDLLGNGWQGTAIPRIPASVEERRACWLHLMRQLSRLDTEKRSEFVRAACGFWGLADDGMQRYLNDPLLRQRFQLLAAPEVKKLADAGMTIGAHTTSHPVLSEQSAEIAQAEIADCRQILRRHSGQAVAALAYPFGDPASVGDREYAFAAAAGYECGFVNVGGAVPHSFSRFSLPRIHVTGEMSLAVYEANISAFHHDAQSMFRR